MSLYTDACHVVTVYEKLVVEYARPSLQTKPSWFDPYVAQFDKVAVDPIKWSNEIVPQFVAVPKRVVDASSLVNSHLAAAADDFADLASHPHDQAAIEDALTQLRSILNVIASSSNGCQTLLEDLDRYSGTTAGVDDPVLLDGIKLSGDQMTENGRHIEYLRSEISRLQAEIEALEHIPTPEAWAKVRADRERIQSDLQVIHSLCSDLDVLTGMNDSIQRMHQQNLQVVANFAPIRTQWLEYMNLLENEQALLNITIDAVPSAAQLAAQNLDAVKTSWNRLLNLSQELSSISYS